MSWGARKLPELAGLGMEERDKVVDAFVRRVRETPEGKMRSYVTFLVLIAGCAVYGVVCWTPLSDEFLATNVLIASVMVYGANSCRAYIERRWNWHMGVRVYRELLRDAFEDVADSAPEEVKVTFLPLPDSMHTRRGKVEMLALLAPLLLACGGIIFRSM